MNDISKEKIYPVYEKIQRNLDQKISLNQLAFFSNYSYFHFHRIFKSSTGESIKQHITRLRLEKSAFELRISNMPIIEIALEAGFGSHEAFSRAFKKQFRVSPSDYRKKHSLTLRSHQKLNSEILGVPESIKLEEIYCKEIESFRIAYVRKFGSYQELPGPLPKAKETKAILKFMEDFKLAPNNHKWVGISNDDPSITKNKNIRFDLGITVGNLFPTTGKVGFQLIKGGRFAIARHRGSYSKLEEVYRFLIHDYPQLSRMKIRNERPFEVYLNPFLVEKLPITDIYIPIH